MFRFGVIASLIGQGAVVTALEEGDGTCDVASGGCAADAGDAMSAIQLRGMSQQQQRQEQQHAQQEKGENYWELIQANEVDTILPYEKAGSSMPECLQGIMYMDQQCLTWDKMKKQNVASPCLGRTSPYKWVNEYVTSMGDWDPSTKCFTAMRHSWTFGDADIAPSVCAGSGIRACQDNAWSHGPCDVGASFGTQNIGFGPYRWFFVKNSEGWTRKTPYWVPFYTYYPVHQVVDGHGHKTKWFQYYMDEAMQLTCPWNASYYGGPRGCRKSQWAAQGEIARCLKPAPLPFFR